VINGRVRGVRSLVLSRIWHAVLGVVALAALSTQFVLIVVGSPDANSSGGPSVSVTTGLVRFFGYFTVQSNLLVLLTAISLVLDPARDGRWWRVLRLDALLGISVTGLVFGAALAPHLNPVGLGWWVNLGFHYLSPLLTFVGWAVFGPRPRIDAHTLVWVFVWPLAWIAYTFVRGAVVDWYPYPFLDVGEIGLVFATLNAGAVILLAALLLALFRVLDRALTPTRRYDTMGV
jgi:hypothetical protein